MHIYIEQNHIPLKRPFAYFLNTLTCLPYAKISIITNNGITGIGEIPCAIDINGELSESCTHLIPYIEHVLQNYSLDELESDADIEQIMNTINLTIAFNTATKCGIEQALFDILSQKTKKSFTKIFGMQQESIKVQGNIPFLENAEEYENRFTEILAKKPDYIKFKVGKNLSLEAHVITTLRKINNAVNITIDANQAFQTVDDAVLFLDTIEHARIAWAEQLIGKHDIAGWKLLKQKTSVPIMADESVQTITDALLFMQNHWIDILNLKIAKCGGILEARKIVLIAKEFDVPVVLGSMLEGENGTKYNLAFALSQNFLTHDFYHYFSLKEPESSPLIDAATLKTTTAVLK
ncbi:MAG: enolase C-terminal domain-like protein [bacterium]